MILSFSGGEAWRSFSLLSIVSLEAQAGQHTINEWQLLQN